MIDLEIFLLVCQITFLELLLKIWVILTIGVGCGVIGFLIGRLTTKQTIT